MHRLFLQRFISKPKSIGSVVPSSKCLSMAMARAAQELNAGERVVEIGAGTGAITTYLKPLNPLVIEIDAVFASLLKQRFPNLEILQTCGVQYLRSLTMPIGLVISVPLINNPLRDAFIAAIRHGHEQGLIRWCVIFTYGNQSPLGTTTFSVSQRYQWILRNLPPAHIWIYR